MDSLHAAGIMKIEDNLIREIVSFCDARSLCDLSSTCSYFHSTIDNIIEEFWWALCQRGWNISQRERRKLCGVGSTMKHTYRMLRQRMRIPCGRFTERFNYIFGKGSRSLRSCWLTLGHTTDARLTPVPATPHRPAKHRIEIRLCVQNVGGRPIVIDLSQPENTVQLFCFDDGKDTHDGYTPMDEQARDTDALEVASIAVIARNGTPVDGDAHTAHCDINPLDFVVLSCKVLCPTWVHYETDFLSMLERVKLRTHSWTSDTPSTATSSSAAAASDKMSVIESSDVDIVMAPEDEVWEYYIELPGGVVLLRDKPLYSVW